MRRPGGVTPLNRCAQKSSNNDHSWLKLKWAIVQWETRKKINVLVWKDVISWTILCGWRWRVYEGWASFYKSCTRSMIQWESIELKKKDHRAGVAPPFRPPPPHPLPGVHNSQPILSKNSHPLQGSQRVDTWRTWIQQFLQTKYNWPWGFFWWTHCFPSPG